MRSHAISYIMNIHNQYRQLNASVDLVGCVEVTERLTLTEERKLRQMYFM